MPTSREPLSARTRRRLLASTGRTWEWRGLRVPGADIAGLGYCSPASKSPFESSLTPELHRPIDMEGPRQAEIALQADRKRQGQKYRFSQDEEPEAEAARARFAKVLPKFQNTKFCRQIWIRDAEDRRLSAIAANSFVHEGRSYCGKFNKSTLQELFRTIDKDASGTVSRREMIVALRGRDDVMKVISDVFHSRGCSTGVDILENPIYQDRHVREKATLEFMKEIFDSVDDDGSGCMSWDEFVDFFRKAGILLEYKTEEDRNWTELCHQGQREKEKSFVPRAGVLMPMVERDRLVLLGESMLA
eukprot:TRINITY_DN23196_c0_g1_i1.p1 TRINITY_DN23196_c0_g1~~TRINITY_DN23196_c0_g1_i1.p1  ORF type:complete len:303 (+),score=67.99 TRINITY_DN23196_c0_g1_i1:164-1072(+)